MGHGAGSSGQLEGTLARLTRVLLDAGLPIRGANTRPGEEEQLGVRIL